MNSDAETRRMNREIEDPFAAALAEKDVRGRSLWVDAWHRLLKNRAAVVSGFIMLMMFLMVVFESRRMKIEPVRTLTDDQKLTREDYKNLLMIAGPIMVILVLLLSTKDNVGTGFSAFIFDPDDLVPLR